MQDAVLLAILKKVVDNEEKQPLRLVGPRGHRGARGDDFDFEKVESYVREWVKEFALKFEDLTQEQIQSLRGKDGLNGRNGRDGRDGSSFSMELYGDDVQRIISDEFNKLSPELKLKFSDLTIEELEQLRGPRGRDGKDGRNGKDFDFEDHREFFESLRVKFKDLKPEEIEQLKLKFSDLTDHEIQTLRGPRGTRGQRGKEGRPGLNGVQGPRGFPGIGIAGPKGNDGLNGKDGIDAKRVVDVQLGKHQGRIYFTFHFDDGSEIETNEINLD